MMFGWGRWSRKLHVHLKEVSVWALVHPLFFPPYRLGCKGDSEAQILLGEAMPRAW